jgi:Skp family chaperone for outer membrane proteins
MAKEVREGRTVYWVDAEGMNVPRKYIPEHDRLRDEMVTEVFEDVQKLHKELENLKETIREKTSAYLDKVADKYGEKWQGNAQLLDFSGERSIEIKISKNIEFDERLQIAKQKIDNYIKELVKNSGRDLVLLVNRAFRVDNKGKVDVRQILGLKQIAIDNPDWQEAMQLIDDAIKVTNTRKYFNFRQRNENGEWETVTLNFSAI